MKACSYGPKRSDTSIALFGDSHALQYSPPMIRLAKKRDWRVVTYMRGNCVIANVKYQPRCDRWRGRAYKRIRAQKPDLILVASATPNRYRVKRGNRRLNRRASERYLRRGMRKTLRALLKIKNDEGRRTKVTLLRDQAIATFRPPDCLMRWAHKPNRCAFPSTRRPNPPGFDFAAARRVPKVRIVQPMNRFCGPKWCPSVRGNMIVFRDTYHLTATYARTLAGWLAARIGV